MTHWVTWKKGFFRFPNRRKETFPSLFYLLGVFGIYLGIAFFLSPFFARFFNSGIVQLLLLCLIMLLITFFSVYYKPDAVKRLWKDHSLPEKRSPLYDFFFGVLAWCVSFPPVVLVGELSDFFLYLIFKVVNYEQIAVRYLKTTLGSPSMFIVAILAIFLAAPVIEEFLFRGCLQSFLKRFMGKKTAIIFASLCFALFHLATSQGLGNISLFVSLFTFACYLGAVYERQGSLFAPIGLHMTFNVVNTLRILHGGY